MRLSNVTLLALASFVYAKNVITIHPVDGPLDDPKPLHKRNEPVQNGFYPGVFMVQDDSSGPQVDHVDLSNPGIKMPSGEQPKSGPTYLTTGLVQDPQISIFAGYLRDDTELIKRLNDGDSYTVVLAPSNAAVASLALKPWQFPNAITGKSEKDKDALANENISSFVANHVVVDTQLVTTFDVVKRARTLSGLEIEIFTENNKILVKSNDSTSTVTKIIQTNNGAIWVMDESLVKPELA
ncbi:YALIA101S06e00782g1_1 [Yarrowia lipolytica]|nr:FAS1 domain-containing protein [Yarrowia lipolytica]SEI35047.1 YALIA101S06e00782g1_1 [Yarrowia lipolytica]